MIRTFVLLMLGLLVMNCAGAAQPDDGELVKLKDEISRINAQQQQILAALNELKQLIQSPGQPVLTPPPTMNLASEPFKGDPGARLALIEYADFQCPFCRRFEEEVYPQIRDKYVQTGQLKYFHRDMPLAFHPGAMPAARAAHCAAEQGRFWQMHDALLGKVVVLSPAGIDERAQMLGLDVAKLDACIASDRHADVIQRSVAEATAMHVSGTPTFIIGILDEQGKVMSVKKTIVGASPFEAFKAALDPLLGPPRVAGTAPSTGTGGRMAAAEPSDGQHREGSQARP